MTFYSEAGLMNIITTKCSQSGKPEFLISCDDAIPRDDVDWLISFLERSVRDGAVYESDQLIQIGWMINTLSMGNDGLLSISEPDLRSLPIKWKSGVTETLRHLRLQKDTADSLGLSAYVQIPSIRESAIVATDVDAKKARFIFERAECTSSDSGWFIGLVKFDA